MRRLAALAGLLMLLGACDEGPEDPDGSVLEGACDTNTLHCVDDSTIQHCDAGTWGEPEECPPELAGDPPLEVEVTTYCTDDGCRPGG
ncbi:MAG: hypothetical protein GY898_09265 [Proteobacteria bacterium]|nr:hypothetical protein [Pseudomonadota bacterium]